jgi:hypothetical protein
LRLTAGGNRGEPVATKSFACKWWREGLQLDNVCIVQKNGTVKGRRCVREQQLCIGHFKGHGCVCYIVCHWLQCCSVA